MDTWQAIDHGSSEQAGRLLARACGASRWVARMLQRRPFGSRERLLSAALEEWNALDEDDWREAFAHHPKIGDRTALAARFPATHDLSAGEQAGVAGASEDVLDALAAANRLYESRFGYIFIVCATGLSAGEMLDRLRTRLENSAEDEIKIAAVEQAKITALRLGATTYTPAS
jgi:2-oxo-4-hydroxy-4-carboxy-5-ureidoimidazoline decarboxylase